MKSTKPVLVQDNNFLKVESLSKFIYNKKIIKNVSIEVKRGEVVGLLGPNGAGKTTCFYTISGLIPPDHGNIYLNGKNITFLPIHKRAQLGLSYLPQESSIFRGLNVEQNIKSVIEASYLNHMEPQKFLDELINDFGLDHLRRASAMTLSGGERRRVEIARSLAAQPNFLLLDEPLAGIDPIALSELRKIIYKLKNRGIGILITDHNVRETLATVDRSYILHDGEVIASGNSNDLLLNQEVRRVYLGEKFKL